MRAETLAYRTRQRIRTHDLLIKSQGFTYSTTHIGRLVQFISVGADLISRPQELAEAFGSGDSWGAIEAAA